jgi:PPOX class probable FMN-dependent enzyme
VEAVANVVGMASVRTIEELEALYGEPGESAIKKEIDHLTDLHRAYVDASPFVVVATSGPGGVDCSPRGDPAGFVRVVDEHTLLLPDRRGNNRTDSLHNLVVDPRIALLFFVPGVNVTLRVMGTAAISTDMELRESFAMDGKLPTTVIVVTTSAVYTQCPKALIRSHLWDASLHRDASELPSMGDLIHVITCGEIDGKAFDDAYPERVRRSMY